MFCIQCGKENPSDATSCSGCGKAFVSAPSSIDAPKGPDGPMQANPWQAVHGPSGFLRKHYHGDYSLGRSFWINSLLISSLAPLLEILTIPWLIEHYPARYSAALDVILTVLGLAAWFWAIRGTWASAGKHIRRSGTHFWANAARLMIVLSIVMHAVGLVNDAPITSENLKVAFGSQPGPAMTIQVRDDGKAILLEGGINDGTAKSLQKALDAAPSVETIILNSDGGWIREGRLIGEAIAARGLDTHVEEECISACTIAFLAGRQRTAAPQAEIGFHAGSPIAGDGDIEDETDQEELRRIYRKAGVSARFIERIVKVPADRVWYPPQDELLSAGVITTKSAGSDEARMAASLKGREKLAGEFRKIPAFHSLSEKYPHDFQSIVDAAWEKIEAGAPDQEVIAAEKEQMAVLFRKLIPAASDQSVNALGTLTLDELTVLRKKNVAACVEMMFPIGRRVNARKHLPAHLVEREMTVMNDIILSSDPANATPLSEQEITQIGLNLSQFLTHAQLEILTSSGKRAVSPAAACDASIAFFRALAMLPMHDRAQFLRVLYGSGT